MKAFKKFIAVAIAAAGVISVAGCAGTTPNYRTATGANWNVRTSTTVEKSFAERWKNNMEVARYCVSFTDGANSTYSVNYSDGEYLTQFYMSSYDWSKNDIPEAYRVAKAEDVYVYTTTLNISGEYIYSSEKKEFNDKIETICYYRLAEKNLQPVYSEQIIYNLAPNTMNATSLASCFIEVDRVYTTYYNYDCTKATTTCRDNIAAKSTADYTPEVTEIGVTDKQGHSVFDNCQIRAAVRAFTLTGGASHSFNVYVPQNKTLQACRTTCAAPVKLDKMDSAQAGIIAALKGAPEDYIFFDDSVAAGEDERAFRYTAVSLGISSDMEGSTPSVWYSTVENSELNYSRSVMLRMSTPVAFALGTLTYNLTSLSVNPLAK